MPELPPLTPQLLQDYADSQGAVESGLSDDCAALEDVLVRLAGPTLEQIEADTNALMEIQQRLAEPALDGIKRDMQRVQRIMRKLFAPTDQSISEDTTMLTGIAARAQGGTFRSLGSSAPNRPANPSHNQMGAGTAHPATRPTAPHTRPAGMGLSRPPPNRPAGGAAGYAATPSVPQSYGQQPVASAPVTMPAPTMGPVTPYEGLPQTGSAIPTLPGPQTTADYEAEAQQQIVTGTPGVPILTPVPSYFPSIAPDIGPVTKPPPPQGPVTSAIPILPPTPPTPLPPTPPVPAPPPPAPEPPAPGCDLCEVAEYLGQILHDGLACICNAIAALSPGTQAQYATALEDESDAQSVPMQRWTDPPYQAETDAEAMGQWSTGILGVAAELLSQPQPQFLGRPQGAAMPRVAAPLDGDI